MNKLSSLIAVIFLIPISVLASNENEALLQNESFCKSKQNSVESEGVVCASAAEVALTSAASQIVPTDWNLRALNSEIEAEKVTWVSGYSWIKTLDMIGKSRRIGFVVDGHKNTVIAMRPTDNVSPGVLVVNSKVKRTREIYNLDEVYARLDDFERLRTEKHIAESNINIPLDESLIKDRKSLVSVESGLFTSIVEAGDLEQSLKDFFKRRWDYTLSVSRHGFNTQLQLKKEIEMDGLSVVDDATSLYAMLNRPDNHDSENYHYEFNVWKGNRVVELRIIYKGDL